MSNEMTANAPGRPATRAEVFAHVINVLDLSNDTMEGLRDVGIVNITRLRALTDDQMNDFIINIPSFNIGDKLAIVLFQQWTRHYRSTHNNADPTDWITTFTEHEYDSFVNSDDAINTASPNTNTTPGMTLFFLNFFYYSLISILLQEYKTQTL